MSGVFISYSRKDADVVRSLVEDLDALGHAAWFDQESSGGKDWWDHVLHQIRESDVVIVAVSSDSLESVACTREFSYALALGKPVLPIQVAGRITPNLMPPALARINIIDYRSQDRASALQLARSLTMMPAAPPLPDPLPQPPPAPISYLGALSEQIESAANLTYAEQSALLLDLRRGTRDPQMEADARLLLLRMRKRRDLLAVIAVEIDELLSIGVPNVQSPPGRVEVAQGSPAAQPPAASEKKGAPSHQARDAAPGRALGEHGASAAPKRDAVDPSSGTVTATTSSAESPRGSSEATKGEAGPLPGAPRRSFVRRLAISHPYLVGASCGLAFGLTFAALATGYTLDIGLTGFGLLSGSGAVLGALLVNREGSPDKAWRLMPSVIGAAVCLVLAGVLVAIVGRMGEVISLPRTLALATYAGALAGFISRGHKHELAFACALGLLGSSAWIVYAVEAGIGVEWAARRLAETFVIQIIVGAAIGALGRGRRWIATASVLGVPAFFAPHLFDAADPRPFLHVCLIFIHFTMWKGMLVAAAGAALLHDIVKRFRRKSPARKVEEVFE